MIKVWRNKYKENYAGRVELNGANRPSRFEVIDNTKKEVIFTHVFENDREFYVFLETVLSFK